MEDRKIIEEWIKENPDEYKKLVITIFKKACLEKNQTPELKLKNDQNYNYKF